MVATTRSEWYRAPWFKGVLMPMLLGGAAVSVAAIGAFLAGSGAEATGGVNGFIEGLSGMSGDKLDNIGIFGFTYAAGMVSTVNPCGFAMLPAYLGLYLGAADAAGGATSAESLANAAAQDRSAFRLQSKNPGLWLRTSRTLPRLWQAQTSRRVRQALIVGLLVTSGVLLLFGTVGIVLSAGLTTIRSVIPWLGLIIGVVLTFAGAWVLLGGKLNIGAFSRAASHMGDARKTNLRGYFLFGLSYGTASLSCTLPIFIAVVGFGTTTSFLSALGQFIIYGLGMGTVILVLTLGMAVFKGAMVGGLRKALPYIQPVSAAIMLLAGSYIVFYWLTLGLDLL